MYERNGSGWILNSLQSLETVAWSLDPLRASAHHKLPTWIVSKRAVTNLMRTGFECFKWAFLAGMHPIQSIPTRLSKYQQFEGLYDFSTLMYPVPLKNIQIFCNISERLLYQCVWSRWNSSGWWTWNHIPSESNSEQNLYTTRKSSLQRKGWNIPLFYNQELQPSR